MGYADNKRQLWKAISTEEEFARARVFTSIYNVDRELMGMASQTPPSKRGQGQDSALREKIKYTHLMNT